VQSAIYLNSTFVISFLLDHQIVQSIKKKSIVNQS